MSKFIRVLVAAVAATALSAHGAQASFHFMPITEVMSGFGADGSVASVFLATAANVANGQTGNNAADFSLSIPAPCNNAGDCGSLSGAPTTTMPPTTTTSVSVTTSSTTSSTSLSLPTGSTSTTIAIPICGNADNNDAITATDALVSLVAAVGAAFCADCFCDVNSAGGVTATDSLLILQSAVGQPVTLVCPPCTF